MKKQIRILIFLFLALPAWMGVQTQAVDAAPAAAKAAQQQGKTVTGIVTDEQGEPVVGANVLVAGSNTGVITDLDGRFTIRASAGSTLRVSYIGFAAREVRITAADTYNITLAEDAEALEEVVVVGYGSIRKSDVTGSVASVNSEEMMKRNPLTLGQGLQGAAAGVSVTRNSGDPAGEVTIRVRGVATVNGSSDPLYVVDGVQVGTSVAFLNPADVQSIEILKDASATAIYGSRGANGVIMITTRNANKGKTRIDFAANFGLQIVGRTLDVANADLFTAGVRQAIINDGTQMTNPAWGAEYSGRLNSIDWQKEMSREAFQQNYNLSASGGTENTQSTLSIGFLNNNGIVAFSNFKRVTGRANISHKVKDIIKLGGNISFVRSERTGSGNLRQFAQAIPTMDHMDEAGNLLNVPIRYPDGTWGHYFKEGNGDTNKGEDNRYAAASDASINTRYANQLIAGGTLELFLAKGLTLRTIASYNLRATDEPAYIPENHRTYGSDANPDEFRMNMQQRNKMELESYLTYEWKNPVHSLTAMAGYSASRERETWINGSSRELPAPNIRQISLTKNTSSINADGGVALEIRFLSYFARATYALKDRYLLTATVRRDGSSNFGQGNRFGTFPSASLAWRITEESFMKNQQAFGNLKLRLGWGQTGNAGIGAGGDIPLFIDQLSSSMLIYYFKENGNISQVSGIAQLREIDTNLKWETNESTNVGLDVGLLGNSLNVSIDYYIRDAKDLLLYRNLRPSTGYANIFTNAGHIRNSGFELSLNYVKQFGDWSLNTTFTGSTLKNEAIEVGDDIYHTGVVSDGDYWNNWSITKNGYPVGSFHGWRVDGIFKSQQEIDALNAAVPAGQHSGVYQTAGVKPGDYRYKDLDGNGYIDDKDRDVIGNGYPAFTYGLNLGLGYKNWDLTAFVYGVAGAKILSYSAAKLTNFYNPSGGYQNVLAEYIQNAWTEQNQGSYPRLTKTDTNHNVQVSDAFIHSGDFLKIANFQIGYSIPQSVIRHLKMERLRIFASADNLFTLSSYNKYGDPEVGNSNVLQTGFDGGRYPAPRTFVMGLSVQF
jgi:TonB-linked SusC/RagA family outer membrane protein